ncbi:hypothetical protein K505DRAFT_338105 [Melanomma pulvis-pyrius CBS 109.77]|uniref:Uncharacterized protein n=1 Tax=Melanomma pulvis-pyrius CBS 109.77 TaxID=1314802 RepID=A0A6A6X9Q8_9PLEO|nr:hypothetical protein K505DRAFT_338105 [Melanomma pulvis-pyrius CBS 109.77]
MPSPQRDVQDVIEGFMERQVEGTRQPTAMEQEDREQRRLRRQEQREREQHEAVRATWTGIPNDNVTDPDQYRTVDELVRLLLDPPRRCKNPIFRSQRQVGKVRIDMQFVQSTLTEAHMRQNVELGRMILKDESKVKTHGQVYLVACTTGSVAMEIHPGPVLFNVRTSPKCTGQHFTALKSIFKARVCGWRGLTGSIDSYR